jgi:hypothetical protein
VFVSLLLNFAFPHLAAAGALAVNPVNVVLLL